MRWFRISLSRVTPAVAALLLSAVWAISYVNASGLWIPGEGKTWGTECSGGRISFHMLLEPDGVPFPKAAGVYSYQLLGMPNPTAPETMTMTTDVDGVFGGFAVLDDRGPTPFKGSVAGEFFVRRRAVVIPIWFLCVLTLSPLGLRLYRRRTRLRTGHCVRCGYDLRGGHSRCPECGQAVAMSVEKHR